MKRLRIYLILSILFVGLIPDLDRLLSDEYEGCNQYDSAFIRVTWENDTCAWGPWPGTVIVRIPGFINTQQILPDLFLLVAPSPGGDWLLQGVMDQPLLGRDKRVVKNLHFQLLPESSFCWLNDYDSFSDCWN